MVKHQEIKDMIMGEWTEEDVENYSIEHPGQRPMKVLSDKEARNYFIKTVTKSKYRAQKTNGYASKKEAEYATQLGMRQKAGEVWFWLEQVPFKLPGDAKHRVDFMVFYHKYFYRRQRYTRTEGEWELVEIKGRDLPMGKLKRKQVEEIYHVKITVI